MLNSKAWLSKYAPIIHQGPMDGSNQNPEEIRLTSGDNFDISEINNWNDVDGNVWTWDDQVSNEITEEEIRATRSIDYSKSDKGDLQLIKSARQCCRNPTDAKNGLSKFFKILSQRAPYYIPLIYWLPKYDWKQNFIADILTGITLAAVVIPQGIAFSAIANLPPVFGLYTSWLPCIFYFLLGTSRQLSIGPEGVISLLTGNAVIVGYDAAIHGDLYEYTIPRACLLAFLVGVMTLVLGILRFGFLDNLISRPILHGFVSASGALILCGQLDAAVGMSVPEFEWEKLIGIYEHYEDINLPSVYMSVSCIIAIVIIDNFKSLLVRKLPPVKFIPTPLVIVVTTTVVTYYFDLFEYGIKILGNIKGGFSGLPEPPKFWELELLEELLIEAVLIAIVGFVESNAIAKTFGRIHNYEVSANRDLVAFGNTNIICSFFGSFPAFGSFVRSKIANSTGAKSQIFSLVSSLIVLGTILFLMPVFHYLPKAAIAAIVIVAAFRLIEFHLHVLWAIRAFLEIFLTFFTFLVTFFLGAEFGIVIAIAISILLVIRHTTLPNVEVLGKTGTGKWKDISVMESEAQIYPGLIVIRIDDSLYFGNVEQLVKMINRLMAIGRLGAHPTSKSRLQEETTGLIIDCRNIHTIDANSITVLHDMIESYKTRKIGVYFSNLKPHHVGYFNRSGLTALLGGPDHINNTVEEAAERLLDRD